MSAADNAVPSSPRDARRSHLESAAWRRALLWGLRNVPVPVQHATMPLWAAFFYSQVPHIRRAIELNLGRLLGLRSPALQLAAFRTFQNYCHCIANAYRVHAGAELELDARTLGLEHLRRALAGGRGAVLATGHVGNWHLGPYFLARHGLPPITVVMTEEPNSGAQAIDSALRDRRMRVVYCGRSPMLSLELRAVLARGELVGLQVDRPSMGGSLRVPCAGGDASFAVGPAQLAWSCDAPIVPVFFPLEGGRLEIVIGEPLSATHDAEREAELRALTAALAAGYGDTIRRYPEQWFNFFDFWGNGARGNGARGNGA